MREQQMSNGKSVRVELVDFQNTGESTILVRPESYRFCDRYSGYVLLGMVKKGLNLLQISFESNLIFMRIAKQMKMVAQYSRKV